MGCRTCLSNTTCIECSSGWVSQSFIVPSSELEVKTCIACQAPCATCYTLPTYCLTCQLGYTLLGTECLHDFYYLLNITYNVTFQELYDKYEGLVNEIVTAVNFTGTADYSLLFPIEQNESISFYLSSQCQPETICSQN